MRRHTILLALFVLFSLAVVGCADKETTDNIQSTQEIIAKLSDTDKEALNNIQNTQKEILAKLSDIEKKISTPAVPTRPTTIDYNKIYTIPIGNSAIKGDKNAPVTIFEFSDFQCPYCSTLQPTLRDVLKTYPKEVKLVYKHFPLSFHAQARNAVKAAEAAREQGKFWEMHDMIFENYTALNDDKFKEFANKLGLDIKKFEADYNSSKYDQLIQQDLTIARDIGVAGTPTLFINGKRMTRRSFEDFKEAIDEILKKK